MPSILRSTLLILALISFLVVFILLSISLPKISASISSVERKIDGIEVGGRNLIRNSEKITDYIILASGNIRQIHLEYFL
jgi:uncharacterized protein YoxC